MATDWTGTLAYPDAVAPGLYGNTAPEPGTLVWGLLPGGTMFLIR